MLFTFLAPPCTQGNTRYLFHVTDAASASSILSSQRMLRGSGGLAGGGIYFAETEQLARQKAQNQGVCLRARVKLGAQRTLTSSDSSITFSSLFNSGYDSVRLTFRNGDEFVVYNFDQVIASSRSKPWNAIDPLLTWTSDGTPHPVFTRSKVDAIQRVG